MGQKFLIERVIMGLVYSFRCKLIIFVIIEVYGENASWALREFVAVIPGHSAELETRISVLA